MEYSVEITETCLEEIDGICEYIEKKLIAEQSSSRLRAQIREKIKNLPSSPRMYAESDKKDREGRKYRKIIIDNYVILYSIIEEDNVILISHMYYNRQNYMDGGLL